MSHHANLLANTINKVTAARRKDAWHLERRPDLTGLNIVLAERFIDRAYVLILVCHNRGI
jgi:hypothetical protein